MLEKLTPFSLALLMAVGRVFADEPTLAQWPHATRIVFSGYNRPGVLTNFPALVIFKEGQDGFAYSQMATTNGADLRFMNAAADTWLSHQIEKWDTNGESFVWVKVPELSGPDTAIWALWGNTNATTPPSYTTDGSTWSQGFTAVYHFNEGEAETVLDSSPVGFHASLMGVPPPAWVSGGAVDGALEFSGNQWIPTDQNLDEISQPATMSAWVRPTTKSGIWPPVISTDNGGYDWSITHNGGYWNVGVGTVAGASGYWVPGPQVLVGEWQHVAAVFIPGQGTRFYFNGEEWSTDTIGTGGGSDNNVMIGANPGPPDFGVTRFIGQIDEVSIAPVVRSAHWIWASYMSQGRNSAFSPWQRMVSSRAASAITATSATLNGSVNWIRTAPTEVWLCWGTNDAGVAMAEWQHVVPLGSVGVGPVSNAVTYTDAATFYYRFYASNGLDEAWSEPAATFISGEVTVEAAVPVVDEQSGTSGVFTVSRPLSCTAEPLTVYYTVGGTADSGEDYHSVGREVTIPAGDASVAIPVIPIKDSVISEGPETVILTLTAGNYVLGASNTATVTITDNASEQPRQWAHQMRITFPSYTRSETLTNFPALVVFNEEVRPGFRYSQMGSPTGADLRFMDSAQTRWLNYEIEEWAPGSNSYVWVQVPELAGPDTAIIALWGNPAQSNAPAYTTNGATWTDGYLGVWHLDHLNGAGQHPDSTAAAYHGADASTVATAGRIAGARSFNTASVKTPLNIDQGGSVSITLSAWAKPASALSGNHPVISSDDGGFDWALVQIGANWNVAWGEGYWDTGVPVDVGAWQFVAAVFMPGTGVRFYKNGAESTSASIAFDPSDSNVAIGRNPSYEEYFAGAIDEARVSGVARSANWVWASWMNQASNAAFVASQPMLANLGATNVTATSADLTGYLYWTNAASTEVWLYWGTNDAGSVKADWDHGVALGARSVGPMSVPVNIAPETLYTYRFYASNTLNEGWADPAAGFVAAPVTVGVSGSGGFVVRRPATVSGGELAVNYTLGGTAVSGVDYRPLPGSVVIPAGSSSVVIPVTRLESFGILRTLVITLAPGGYFVGAPNTAALTFGPHPSSWFYRMEIVFSGYAGAETLTNFPAQVVFDEALQPEFRYGTFASPTGGDLRFSDGAATRWLAYEVDEWNPAGVSRVWVRVPELAGTNTTIWAYWGNLGATTPPAYTTNGATWSEKYSLVYHLNEGSGSVVRDSTSNAFNGTLVSNPARTTDPAMGRGVDLDGISQYIDSTKVASTLGVGGANPKTGEAWVYVQADPKNPDGSVFSMGNTWANYAEFTMRQDCQAGTRANWWGALIRGSDVPGFTTTPEVTTLGNWMHMAFSYGPGPAKKAYVNGVLKGSVAGVAANTMDTRPLTFGMHYDQSNIRYLDGVLGEVRMSAAERSQDWLWATWRSQSAPATFAAYRVVGPPAGALLIVR